LSGVEWEKLKDLLFSVPDLQTENKYYCSDTAAVFITPVAKV
jgi:hypothetical protein